MRWSKKRVFISSVQKEFEIERVAIAGAVSSDESLSRFCDVFLYDKEPLSGRRIAKPYLKCLDSCDVYILVMDREYGRIVDTISATHSNGNKRIACTGGSWFCRTNREGPECAVCLQGRQSVSYR